MADRTAAIVPPLGDLCTVEIDPGWPYAEAWREENPIGDKLSFAFLDLEQGISEDSAANYADTEVVGRAEQFKTFVGTSNREIQLTFKFQVQGLATNTVSFPAAVLAAPGGILFAHNQRERMVHIIEQEVVHPALWLDALKHPVITKDGLSHAPPPVLLTVGRLISARCILTGGSPMWQGPFDPETLMPFAAEFQAVFTVVRSKFLPNLFGHKRQYR